MKLRTACCFLLTAVVVEAFKPAEYSWESDGNCLTEEPISDEIKYQSPPADSFIIPKFNVTAPRENWDVECSSQYKGYKCSYAIDNRDDKYWQSSPRKKEAPWIKIDLRKVYLVSGLTMRPRLDKDARGQIGEHRILLSKDGENWTEVAYGTWGSNRSPKMSAFEPTFAQYVKLVAETESLSDRSQIRDSQISISNLAVYSYNGTYPTVDPNKGVWGPTINLPIVPVSSAIEQHGNIIMWSAWADDQFFASPGGKTLTTTMKRDGTIAQTEIFETKHDMFCPGTSMDFDGNLIISGGADSGRTSVYNGKTWERGPGMQIPRGYHSSTTLSDGRIFAIGGSWSGGDKIEKNGEVYYPGVPNSAARWETRPGAKVEPMMTDDRLGPWRADNHGWLFGWKNASVFQAGPSAAMHWFDVDAKDGKGRLKGSYTDAGSRGNDTDSMSGNAVMYDATKGNILTFGGQRHYDGSSGSSNAHIITLGELYEPPVVKIAGMGSDDTQQGGMHRKRVFHTSVILPDGKIFITGGQSWGQPFNEGHIEFTPEIYDPETDTFLEQSRNNIKRVYHSISMLLPDGTVLNGGGGLCGNCAANHYDAQIFTPPYLFAADGTKATRPVIVNAYPRLSVGEQIKFQSDMETKSASLIRVGTTTHTVNTDQRRVPLDIQHVGNQIYVADLPNDPGVVLPGWYMLFIINSEGTPSLARMVKIELSRVSYCESHKDVEGQKQSNGAWQAETSRECNDVSQYDGPQPASPGFCGRLWELWRTAMFWQG